MILTGRRTDLLEPLAEKLGGRAISRRSDYSLDEIDRALDVNLRAPIVFVPVGRGSQQFQEAFHLPCAAHEQVPVRVEDFHPGGRSRRGARVDDENVDAPDGRTVRRGHVRGGDRPAEMSRCTAGPGWLYARSGA